MCCNMGRSGFIALLESLLLVFFAFSHIGDKPFHALFLLSRWFMLVLPFQVAAILMEIIFGTQVSVAVKFVVFGFVIF